MTQQTEASPNVSSPAAPVEHSGDVKLNSRAEALMAKMAKQPDGAVANLHASFNAKVREERAASANAADESPPNPVESLDASPPKDLTRVEKIAELERAAVRKRQEARSEHDKREQEWQAKQRALAEREASIERRLKSLDDPSTALDWLEKNVGPEKLVAWLAEQQDPAVRAAAKAKKEMSPLEERLARLEAENNAMRQHQAATRAESEFRGVVKQFADSDARLTAAALEADPEWTIGRANAIANDLTNRRQEWNIHTIAYLLEQELARAAKAAQGRAPAPADEGEQQTTGKSGKNGTRATGPGKTISNRDAAVVAGRDDHRGSGQNYEQRIAAAERRARRQS